MAVFEPINKVFNPDWRNASKTEWIKARWYNPYDFVKHNLNCTNKFIVSGHINAYYGHILDLLIEEKATDIPQKLKNKFSEFKNNPIYINQDLKYIGIDACTVISNRVNVLVLNENEI